LHLFLLPELNWNNADSVVSTIHLYDSLVLVNNSDAKLLESDIQGSEGSLQHYKGVAFYKENPDNLSKLDLFFDSKPEQKVTVHLYRNKIILITVSGLKYYYK
jgi:hypothetical protein